MRSKPDKGLLRVLLVLGLLLGILILAEEQGGMVQAPAVATAEQLPGRLASDIQDLKGEADEDGKVTVVIKLREPSLSDVEQGMVVEKLKRQAVQSQKGVLEFLDTKDATVLNTFWLTNAVLAKVPVDLLEALASLPEVEGLFENFTITIPGPPEPESLSSVPSGTYTWGLEKIRIHEVWDMGITGSGVRVAVLDTGVDISHPDLAGKMWTDEPNDPTYPGGWIEFDQQGNIVPGSTPHDTYGHGTHVSGTVVGGNESGIAIGVSPGAWLMHGLVAPEALSTWAQVMAGMQWCIAPFDQHGNPAGEPANVINMSAGFYGYLNAWIKVVREIKTDGIALIASIGNAEEGTSGSPGNVYEVFGIGATDTNDNVASFSSGEVVYWWASRPWPYIKPDLSAPGDDVLSAIPVDLAPPDLWAYASGTSMAAPHVAGTVALMLEANPALTVDEIYEILKDTAVWYDRYYDEKPCTRYGWGRIDVCEAVAAATLCDLTISSSAGGSVTTPGEGVFAYGCDTVVDLKAEAEDGYQFVNWTGNVDTIDDVDAAETTITMDSSYSIIANFKKAGGCCCSATAAYGTPMAEELQILRKFRDEYLLTNPLGRAFVDFYYWVSPPIAEFITEHAGLKPIVRAVLVPAVAMSTVAVNTTPLEKMAIVSMLVLVFVVVAWAIRHRDRCPEYS